MEPVSVIFLVMTILTVHFVGDFILQSDQMALRKSKEWEALLRHVGAYSIPFWPLAFAGLVPFGWVFINLGAHFFTDAITSRWTSKLWFLEPAGSTFPNLFFLKEPSTRHWFFVVIGFDQLLHAIFLLGTLTWLF